VQRGPVIGADFCRMFRAAIHVRGTPRHSAPVMIRHAGALSSGLHHASTERVNGFCTFNGLALVARALMDGGANHVLILDLDAYCEGGTYEIVHNWPGLEQFDIAVSEFDGYECGREGDGG
jgi:acetoin utilization deacetylase AcuC-like enzyme